MSKTTLSRRGLLRTGAITGADGQTERFDRHDDAVITLGSYGAIAPRG